MWICCGRPGLALVHLDGDRAETVASYQRAIQLAPSLYPSAHYHRAVILNQLGARAQESLAAFESYLELEPHRAQIHGYRATLLVTLGRDHRAVVRAFDSALAINPRYVEAHVGRGNALSELGREAEALGAYNRALAVEPSHKAAAVNRVSSLSMLGQGEQAATELEQSMRLTLTVRQS